MGHLSGEKWGYCGESLRYHRKHSATGVLLHLSRDRGGYFGGDTKGQREPKDQKSPPKNKVAQK